MVDKIVKGPYINNPASGGFQDGKLKSVGVPADIAGYVLTEAGYNMPA